MREEAGANMLRHREQQGFTLIELVIVVIILGLLAAAAVPRFVDVRDDAEDASVEGIAGGYASAVSLVRAQWELEGGNSGGIVYSGNGFGVDPDTGYPTGGSPNSNNQDTQIDDSDCVYMMENLLQSAPTVTNNFGNISETRLFGKVVGRSEADGGDQCFYYLSSTIVNQGAAPNDDSIGSGLIYTARTGSVVVFQN